MDPDITCFCKFLTQFQCAVRAGTWQRGSSGRGAWVDWEAEEGGRDGPGNLDLLMCEKVTVKTVLK